MNSRRRFLQGLVGGPAAAGVGAGLASGCASARAGRSGAGRGAGREPRRIIHLVVDGMSIGMLSCANHYSELTRGRRLTWLKLLDRADVMTGMMDVRSQNSLVTDSSASSSAWGSGVRIPNGKVNQASTGAKLVTLYELMADAGWKRGLVTTTEVTHATPAGFAACTNDRGNAEEIAVQYLDRRMDVVLGGGRKFFRKADRKDKRDLLEDFSRAGYSVLQTPGELESAPMGGRWLGVFASSHLPFVVDQRGGLTKVEVTPPLAGMASAALRRLGGEERFILQIEGGRVDHGCHANDAASAIHELLEYDAAIDVCLEFQKEHPETLLVMTTDHSTGNPGLNGMGDGYGQSSSLFRNLSLVRQSVEEMVKRLRLCESRDAMLDWIRLATGYHATSRRVDALDVFLKKKGHPLYEGYNSENAATGQLLANHVGISFTSTAHTSDHVPVLAVGPGAEAFRGFIQNTEIFERYTGFAGVRYANPQEPLLAAGDILLSGGVAAAGHHG